MISSETVTALVGTQIDHWSEVAVVFKGLKMRKDLRQALRRPRYSRTKGLSRSFKFGGPLVVVTARADSNEHRAQHLSTN